MRILKFISEIYEFKKFINSMLYILYITVNVYLKNNFLNYVIFSDKKFKKLNNSA